MEKKRISAIIMLAVVSTVTPFIYQFIIEPRMDASSTTLSISGIAYNPDESNNNKTAFNLYITLKNDETNDVILSPLNLDVYYYVGTNYRLIGEFKTNQDYVIPGTKSVTDGAADSNWIGSSTAGRIDTNGREALGYNLEQEVKGTLSLFKDAGFKNGSNLAMINLINTGAVTFKFKGNAQYGPVAIPYETGDVALNMTIWDTELVIKDVFLYEDPLQHTDTFVLHTKMRNPSGIPITLNEFTLDLYNKTNTVLSPVTEADKVGTGINSIVALTQSNDPDENNKKLNEVFLNKDIKYTFTASSNVWQDVFFVFNMTNTDNIKWLVTSLMDQDKIEDITLRGKAKITLGDAGTKGYPIDMTHATDTSQWLTLTNVDFLQKVIEENENQIIFKEYRKMSGDLALGDLEVKKMRVDTNPLDPRMNLTIDAEMSLSNPYRFEYDIENLNVTYRHKNTGFDIACSEKTVDASILRARRWENTSFNPLHETLYPRFTKEIMPSTTNISLDLIADYNSEDPDVGIYKVLEDLGANPRMVNLTNPFWLEDGTIEHDQNPLNTMTFLIDSNINPLTMLNEISLLAMVNQTSVLGASHFGNRDRDISTVYRQATSGTDMPWIEDPIWEGINWQTENNNFDWDSTREFATFEALANWDSYYDDAGGFEVDLREQNLYEIIDYDFGDTFFDDDEDLDGSAGNAGIVRGIITDVLPGQVDRTGSFANTLHSDLLWRVYQEGSFANGRWGPAYDFFEDGDHGYFMGTYLGIGERLMFSQNFTIDDANKYPDGINDIEQVTLSISYRYRNPTQNSNDRAFLMFDWASGTGDKYEYDFNDYSGTTQAFDSRYGWTLPNPGDGEWAHYCVDLTDDFKSRLSSYFSGGRVNKTKLQGEISFAGWCQTGAPLKLAFDDIVLNIRYKDYTSNSTGVLNVEDFFNQLQETDSEYGNLFKIFEELSEDSYIDATEFWEYIANDGNNPIAGTDGADFFKFLQFQNISFSEMTDILQNRYQELDIGEPANFLDMLRNTKYKPIDPLSLDPINDARYVNTKYGPRFLGDDKWVLEDPLNASRTVSQTLYQNIFRKDDYTVSRDDLAGEELWFMLENLGVTMPWVVMYLLTHGWTKDDIFDVLEALGMACEINYGYADDRDYGQLTSTVDVNVKVLGGFVEIDINDMEMFFDMDPVLLNGTQELFSALCAAGLPSGGAGKTRAIVDNSGEFTNAEPTTYSGGGYWDVGIFGIQIWIDVELVITPQSFALEIYVNPDPTRSIATPASGDIEVDDYLILGAGGTSGLNDAGTRQLASNWRTNLKFAGETFVTLGGDPISLFQFLDTYYFGWETWDRENEPTPDVYTSFTLLNYFNISGADFIDVITGYNNKTKLHDQNGNGLADDWIAPDYYGGGNPGIRGSLEGWGTNFRDNRLFWHPGYDAEVETGQTNGKIIWSDSPDFASAGHSNGEIVVGVTQGDYDEINKSAPYIVDIFDMLAWISETSGFPDPDDLFRWLLGQLPDSMYSVFDPLTGTQFNEGSGASRIYHKGLNNQKVWRMFRKGSFNATGFFNWMENEKNINSFKFLFLLNESTQILNPLDFLFFAGCPNMVRYWEDSISLLYHDALDSQSTVDANDALWNYFSTLSNEDLKGFFNLINNTNDHIFNIFEIFVTLQINPASWVSYINEKTGVSPIDVIKNMLDATPTSDYLEYTKGSYTIVQLIASYNITYDSGAIQLDNFKNIEISGPDGIKLYANTGPAQFENFIRGQYLKGENFTIF